MWWPLSGKLLNLLRSAEQANDRKGWPPAIAAISARVRTKGRSRRSGFFWWAAAIWKGNFPKLWRDFSIRGNNYLHTNDG